MRFVNKFFGNYSQQAINWRQNFCCAVDVEHGARAPSGPVRVSRESDGRCRAAVAPPELDSNPLQRPGPQGGDLQQPAGRTSFLHRLGGFSGVPPTY